MTLQARLTLWSVIVIGLIVGMVSALDLIQEIQHQFDSTLERSEGFLRLAENMVIHHGMTSPEQMTDDPKLQGQLLDIMSMSATLLEIAVCAPDGTIIVDSDPLQVGKKFPDYENFEQLVKKGGWRHMLRVLLGKPQHYQLWQALGVKGKSGVVYYLRVVVYPTLINKEIGHTLRSHALLSLASLAGAIVAAFLFSTIAYRPLGKLGQTLDMLASGKFEGPELPPPSPRSDEFGVVASKVNLLGQQLRGAQYDISDLRGNFERLLEELEDAVLVFGRDRRLVVVAGAVEKFLHENRSALIGKPLNEVFPPTTSLGLLLAQISQTGRSIRNRRVPISGNGDTSDVFVALLSVDILDSLNPAASAASVGGMMVRLRDPEATRQIGRQLQTADRLSAISRITGGVAHEVKNPLNAILMHVELAKMKLARGDNAVGPEMEIIASEIIRLDRVVKTFLDFTRPVELQLTDVPLDSFVNDVVALARPLAQNAKIQISVEQHTGGAAISVDQDLLKQAILNIVMNAIEAMPNGGILRFESSAHGDMAEIRVSDTGAGIPPELKEKIFALYFTTKQKGSGIGLAMTFRIVQLHDGTITFTSDPGSGTTFVLSFPAALVAS